MKRPINTLKQATDHIAELEGAVNDLIRGIENFLHGNYPHPRGHRPNTCKHGTNYWDECVQCDCEYFEELLRSVRNELEAA